MQFDEHKLMHIYALLVVISVLALSSCDGFTMPLRSLSKLKNALNPWSLDSFTSTNLRILPNLSKHSKHALNHRNPLQMSRSSTLVEGGAKTLKRFMEVECLRSREIEEIYPIVLSIESACRDINRLIRRTATDKLSGNTGGNTINIQGEQQKQLDVIANTIMKNSLCCSGKLSAIASEEEENPCLCSDVTDNWNTAFSGDYVAVFDPLDGSSNVDSGLPTGTIFGIYKASTPVSVSRDKERDRQRQGQGQGTGIGPGTGYGQGQGQRQRQGKGQGQGKGIYEDTYRAVRQRGSELLCAGYCLYSAQTHLVITMRDGLHMFTIDDMSGEFFLTQRNVQIPQRGPLYCYNDVHADSWVEKGVKEYFSDFKKGVTKHTHKKEEFDTISSGSSGSSDDSDNCGNSERTSTTINTNNTKPTSRYMGALVADAHNVIFNGGIFAYPGNSIKPHGKIRLLYEANPMALVFEQGAGAASDGHRRILDLPVGGDIHCRTPLFLGSVENVDALRRYVREYAE